MVILSLTTPQNLRTSDKLIKYFGFHLRRFCLWIFQRHFLFFWNRCSLYCHSRILWSTRAAAHHACPCCSCTPRTNRRSHWSSWRFYCWGGIWVRWLERTPCSCWGPRWHLRCWGRTCPRRCSVGWWVGFRVVWWCCWWVWCRFRPGSPSPTGCRCSSAPTRYSWPGSFKLILKMKSFKSSQSHDFLVGHSVVLRKQGTLLQKAEVVLALELLYLLNELGLVQQNIVALLVL